MLSDFAKHTRQSAADANDTTSLCKKYLAVHCTMAPMPMVYAQVASDFQLLELRTHNPPIHAYAQGNSTFDPNAFVTIMRDGYSHIKGPVDMTNRPALSYFIDSLFPKPVGQEEWYDWHYDQDTWKQRAYFMAMNCGDAAGFYDLVKAIAEAEPLAGLAGRGAAGEGGGGEPQPVGLAARSAGGEGSGREAPFPGRGAAGEGRGGEDLRNYIADLHTRITRLRVDKKMPPCTAQELGSIINELVMPEQQAPVPKVAATAAKTEVPLPEARGGGVLEELPEKKLHFVPVGSSAQLAPPQAAQAAAQATQVQEFRKRSQLNVTFPPARVAKQLIFSAMKFVGTEYPHFEKLRGKDQEKFAAFDANQDAETLKACIAGLNAEKLAACLNEKAKDPSLKCVPVTTSDPKEFIGYVVEMYAFDESALVRQNKAYLKQFPKPSEAVIEAIMKA